MRLSNEASTMSLSRNRRRRLRLFPKKQCDPPAFPRRMRPVPVSLKRLAAARLVFILGMIDFRGRNWPLGRFGVT